MADTQTQTYKLPDRLESLINSAIAARYLRESAQEGVGLELKRQAYKFYSNPKVKSIAILVDPRTFLGDNDHQFERELIQGEESLYSSLDKILEEGEDFGRAKQFYLNNLNEDFKVRYASMLFEKGIIPDAPAENAGESQTIKHQKLVQAANILHYVRAMELAVRKRDLRAARKLLEKNAPGVSASDVLGNYIVREMAEAELNVYDQIAKANRIFAENIIKQNKLYELMDKGIAKHPLGKAYALVAMHELYSAQSVSESDVNIAEE